MSGIELIGVVAAIPGLVELVKTATSITRQLVCRKAFQKEATDLLTQLELIEGILNDVSSKFKTTSLSQCHIAWLCSATKALKDDLTSLNAFLNSSVFSKEGPQLLKRARLFVSGFDRKIKQYRDRLERTKSSLTLAIAEENLATSRTNIRVEFQRILHPCGHNFIPSSLSGTCEWIWTHPVFCQWLHGSSASPESHESRLMCIYGTKGCGKSVLSRYITERLKREGKAATFFSFWAGSESQRKLLDLLQTLLWNLVQKLPDSELNKILSVLLDSQPPDENTLRDAITKSISLVDDHIYCIIDGIDESVDDWSLFDHGSLKSALQLMTDNPRLHVLFLGREPSVRTMMTTFPLRIEITEELVGDDIGELIKSELDRVLGTRSLDIRELVQKTLQENSHMMFLWITLIFKELNRCHLPSEIRRALDHVPYDLDREYHRLFVGLLERLGGSSSSPSVPLKRVKRLLSLILAAPEPLTCDELQYAFAISEHPKEGYEEYLISKDGIVDSCGDLVRVSDGRYHIVHTSAAEFLTRPVDQWKLDDENIIFFQIDPLDAQKDICMACMDYLSLNDLGYPITDDTTTALPSRLPFFSHAAKFLPWYLMNIYSSQLGPVMESKVDVFIDSPQFCALVEYVAVSLQDSSSPIAHHYIEFFNSLPSTDNVDQANSIMTKAPILARSFARELECRQAKFDTGDVRCQTWMAISNAVALVFGFHDGMNELASDSVKESRTGQVSEATYQNPLSSVTRNSYSVIPRQKIEDMEMMLGSGKYNMLMKSIANSIIPFTNMISIPPAHLLPTPFLIMFALILPRLEQQIDYMSIACKRLKNKHDILESYCLLRLANMLNHRDDMDESIECLLRQALQIATGLCQYPHVTMLVCSILYELTCNSFLHGKDEEASKFSTQLRNTMARESHSGKQAVWWERQVYHRNIWGEFKFLRLNDLARVHRIYENYEEALNIVEQVIMCYESTAKKKSSALVPAYHTKALCLYSLGRYKESETIFRIMLKTVTSSTTKGNMYYRMYALALVGYCLLAQRKEADAKQWASRINLDPATIESSNTMAARNLGRFYMEVGDFERAELTFRKIIAELNEVSPTTHHLQSDHIRPLLRSLGESRPRIRMYDRMYTCIELENSSRGIDISDDLKWWHERALTFYYNIYGYIHEKWDIMYLRYISLATNRENLSHRQTETMYRKLATLYANSNKHRAAAAVFDHLRSRYTEFPHLLEDNQALEKVFRYFALGLFHKGKIFKAFIVCLSIAFMAQIYDDNDRRQHLHMAATYHSMGKTLALVKLDDLKRPAEYLLVYALYHYDRAMRLTHAAKSIRSIRKKIWRIQSLGEELGLTDIVYHVQPIEEVTPQFNRRGSLPDLQMVLNPRRKSERRNSIQEW